MTDQAKTVIVTGASQGIGAGVVRTFLRRGYNVVATSRRITESQAFAETAQLTLIDGDLADQTLADRIIDTAVRRYGSLDALVNNAGIFFSKPFLDYTAEDYQKLSSINVEGFLHITQGTVRQILAQKTPGSVVTLTTARVANPIAGSPASVPLLTKGGLEVATRSLALEFAPQQIRFNAVAPGTVDTPMQAGKPKEQLQKLSPMGIVCSVADIVEAVVYLTEAQHVTGEVLHVDGGAHVGKW